MNLDAAEVHRISGRLGALQNRDKLLASYIAVGADDVKICSELGLKSHELLPAVSRLCTELHMSYLPPGSWRPYVRAAVLLVATPERPAEEKPVRYKVSREAWKELEPIIASYLETSKRTSEPKLGAIFSTVPALFAFSMSLCGSVEHAQDIVQEVLTRAYRNLVSFQPGSNLRTSMRSWLFTIAHNYFMSERRYRRREAEDPNGAIAEAVECLPDQIPHLEVADLAAALEKLPQDQRDVVLMTADGFQQDEIAAMCGCPVGTVKSRVHRARLALARLIGAEADDGSRAGMYLAEAVAAE